MTQEQKAKVEHYEALANAATEGPWSLEWVAGALRHINRNVDFECFMGEDDYKRLDEGGHNYPQQRQEDYLFVTESRTAIPYLIALVREQEAELERRKYCTLCGREAPHESMPENMHGGTTR